MGKIEWLEGNRIKVAPPKRPKKITGTRFAAIMGLNPYATPFKVWCAITRTYEEPFVDTIYTRAGKVIEPKQAEFIQKEYFWTKVVAPADVYGEDYFKTTRGDFFHENKILGGMWDYLFQSNLGKISGVIECKTTKRAEDWADDVPEYYALQAALYAWLLDVDDVYMVPTFLAPEDYKDPAVFVCDHSNTTTKHFKVSERYPDMEKKMQYACAWWHDYVESGISPPYDEKLDADILKVLRENSVNPDSDIKALISEAETLKGKLDAHAAEVADLEKRYKTVTGMIKDYAMSQFRPTDTKVSLGGGDYEWSVSKSTSEKADLNALKADGLLKYITQSNTYRISMKKKE